MTSWWIVDRQKNDTDTIRFVDAEVKAKDQRIFVATIAETSEEDEDTQRRALKFFNLRNKHIDQLEWDGGYLNLTEIEDLAQVLGPDAKEAWHAYRTT